MAKQQLKKEIAAMQRKLSQLETGKTRQGKVVAASVQQAQVRAGGKRRKKRSSGNAGDGSMTISRTEFVKTLDSGTKTLTFTLDVTKLSWIGNIAKSFERVVWLQAEVFWKPACATTTAGIIAYGVDWATESTVAYDRQKVLALTPVNDHPIWQSTDNAPLRLPQSKLMSRKEYIIGTSDLKDLAPGILRVDVSSDAQGTYGEVWLRYRVRLSGTKL